MENQVIGMIAETVVLMTVLTFVTIFLFFLFLGLYNKLKIFLIIAKLKKYDLKKYDIVFNQKGIPTTLVSQEDKSIIFL